MGRPKATWSKNWKKRDRQRSERTAALLANIKAKMAELKHTLGGNSGHWGYEDPIYRFYYGSFKVYLLREQTREIAELLWSLAPKGCGMDPLFYEITMDGVQCDDFELSHNSEWARRTRPIVEAFLHARLFLEMAIKYGEKYDEPPQTLDSGWAALLCLYELR